MLRKQYYYRDIFSRWVDLAYDNVTTLFLILALEMTMTVLRSDRVIENFIEFIEISILSLLVFVINCIKGETIRKIIY